MGFTSVGTPVIHSRAGIIEASMSRMDWQSEVLRILRQIRTALVVALILMVLSAVSTCTGV